ncbi:hypothetical protein [Winogradskyella sp.]|uniref:hypothetical protein n=1 Tax=Winogradskyella sp. TaxID=1883156 RepID=UPI002634016A|nr:hypothetical protein [Winogradskyella sp.]
MYSNLAPTYQQSFGEYCVLWYSKSNNYSVVDNEFKVLLDDYLSSDSLEIFTSKVTVKDSVSNPIEIAENLQLYLERCNVEKAHFKEQHLEFENSKTHIKKYYRIKDKIFQVNFDSDLVKKIIHPSIAYLEIPEDKPQTIFDIYLDLGNLCLFENEKLITAVPKREYHRLQGKFVIRLLILIHEKNESDWLATLHGSTVADGNDSILFVGQSGKGKSTLCALLSAHGFELVADDVSPMLFENRHIYYNPSAISIKEGAFNTLRPLINFFDNSPTVIFNKTKGKLKYIPCEVPSSYSYPCKYIIMVNYCEGADTELEHLSVKNLLETLIPDSWISPNPQDAKQFLDWLKNIYFYRLTYSDTKSAIEEITTLFKTVKNN